MLEEIDDEGGTIGLNVEILDSGESEVLEMDTTKKKKKKKKKKKEEELLMVFLEPSRKKKLWTIWSKPSKNLHFHMVLTELSENVNFQMVWSKPSIRIKDGFQKTVHKYKFTNDLGQTVRNYVQFLHLYEHNFNSI